MDISIQAASVGFDWAAPEDVLDKVDEEIAEIRQALNHHESRERICEEIGDLFFALVNFSRKMQINPEDAFRGGVEKFERRYHRLCDFIEKSGHQVADLDSNALEEVWQAVKSEENHAQ